MIYLIFLHISLCLFLFISANQNHTATQISVEIESLDNTTFILYYNLTTDYPYYLTFRLFEHEAIKYGLFPATHRYEYKSLKIFNQSGSSAESVDLFVICFHFLRRSDDIEIQCKDLRVVKTDFEILPTYKPLFVPLMYALSILMLLPMMIQHRHHKRKQLLERRKQLRRLSLTISPDNPDLLTDIVEKGHVNVKKIPIQIELVSLPPKQVLEDIDDNDNVTYTLQTIRSSIENSDENDDDNGPSISADECIAHLLNNIPWKSHLHQHSPMISSVNRQPRDVLCEQQVPVITILTDRDVDEEEQDDGSNDKRPILKPKPHHTVELFITNPVYTDADI
ncbi:unnamed protein product [Adineta ricciae]|uniref:Uncharacterized protein n=1 Tax=Adineta ricciae TaxID=249248 RepID=A0A815UWX3_ADIRI|nr:unnamed protein product [Adineta ricciae]